ncbi:hypothetical protein [Patulibacter sp. SYSU D01012]|uniref:hypothetical protein n=1 Tax=Patulibacter sp. SYSU D01012 TaxID=2817381 RepID=UPI001B31119E|nr:hypothetical protein [Patulibacter sp. SYSU D01012]
MDRAPRRLVAPGTGRAPSLDAVRRTFGDVTGRDVAGARTAVQRAASLVRREPRSALRGGLTTARGAA